MRELALIALSEDGRYLFLRDPVSGSRLRLRVDDRLAQTIGRSAATRTVPGQMEIPMQSSLTPREIQARIRRGESVEQVAEAAGTNVDAVIGFATPVLAEREYVVEQARATTVRRKHVGGNAVALGALLDEALAERRINAEDAEWDSYRREDGRWTVVVTIDELGPAHFVYDTKSRYVISDDEAARELVGDFADPANVDMELADAVTESSPTATAVVDEHAPVHSLKEARDRRALGLFDDDPTVAETPEQAAPKRPSRRSSVPSWDEIMFGGRRD